METSSRWTSWWRRERRERPGPAGGDAAARLDLLLGAARAGFPVAPAAHPAGYRCSCDRVGCPAPAQHPLSFAWQSQATTDAEQLARWLSRDPEANFVTATGRAHDVLDVPAEAGVLALQRLEALGAVGPVAAVGADRYLFFTATRGTPQDEDEWWTSALDSTPDTVSEHPGLRWHCRGSYTLVPPAALPDGSEVRWLRGPELALPDPLRVLDVLTDACTEVGAVAQEQWLIG
ncbi:MULTISPECIES: bifunctional DNA primase/polymerase [Kitasatospora]|uniref:Bifunctional DNA primase/polymerase-like protein n=1 Tax=Kitasatospora cineracea TaxID=88074 RepID=A0A3N4RNS2_9ACTN|nr:MULTISPECIES: bifunctional DNA primase/polymerase [Kitasatospora]ROR44623.1 bifunctional DNA primase/polymerase-like protein [Kitasatospora cineracea]RPE35068.1 bifunctional DNA primase/polymerase-like protein [Kitasatospora cineracea]WAL71558.1 bifunctional DNA primase/polymerase [Kitasatospora sp. YST-16]WNW37597.1 bifunctional DNA primase/polymerase [Streptomyces sp. Li-HN-5-13]